MERLSDANGERFFNIGILPDPPNNDFAKNFDYDSSGEEKFDENIHLG